MLTILAPQSHGGNSFPCNCGARIASLGVPSVKITPNRVKYSKLHSRWCNFLSSDVSCPPQGTTLLPAPTRLPPPFPRPLPTRPVPTITLAGCVLRFRLCALSRKILLFFASSRAGQYQTVTTTFCCLSSARFDGDFGYVVTDVYLLCRRVAMRGRGCQPQLVDFGRKQSTQAVTSCRLHSLPQRTNPHPACVRPSNTTWPTSHASALLWGGGLCQQTREVITISIIIFIYYFYSTLTPSSFISRSFDLHIRQVDDCVADDKLEGGQVDMQAEEVEEHVGVDLSVGVVGKNKL
jgi:hypothetical protein